MKKLISVLVLLFLSSSSASAQSQLGAGGGVSPTVIDATQLGIKADGKFCLAAAAVAPGASSNITCYTQQVTSPTLTASVTGNVATVPLAGNPLTLGWGSGNTVVVSGFVGGDTYFNGTFTTTGVTSNAITYALVHGDATASIALGLVINQSVGPFTSADVGKDIQVTNGCCFGAIGTYNAVVINAGTIQSITNSKTAVSSAVTGGGTCTTNCWIAYGTNDDVGWSAVDAQIMLTLRCPTVLVPAGTTFIKQAHLNSVSPTCAQPSTLGFSVSTVQDAGFVVRGQGLAVSTFFIENGFDFTTCSTGCFFSPNSTTVQDLSFTGGGNSLSAQTHNNRFINLGAGGLMSNVSLTAYGASDTALIGLLLSWSHFYAVTVDMFGFNPCLVVASPGPAFASTLTCGNSAGIAFAQQASSYIVTEQLNLQNVFANHPIVDNFGRWDNYSGNLYGQTATNTNALTNESGGVINFFGSMYPHTCANCNSLVNLSGGTVRLFNSSFTGGNGTGKAVNNLGKLFDQGGNTYGSAVTNSGTVYGTSLSATGTLLTAGALVLSANWGTSATVTAPTGSNPPNSFTITNGSAATGAAPTITYTFPTPYPFIAPQWCTATQVGGTNAVGTFTSSALTVTGVTFTFSLTPTANNTEFVQVVCPTVL